MFAGSTRLKSRTSDRGHHGTPRYSPPRSAPRLRRRPARYSPRSSAHGPGIWWKVAAAVAVSGAVAALVVTGVIRARESACSSAGDQIIAANQVTAEEGGQPSPPAGLMNEAQSLAACAGGQLVIIEGAGQRGVQPLRPVSLRIYREPGELENDPAARQIAVQNRIERAFRAAWVARVHGDGRDVLGLLAAVSSQLGKGLNEVWLRTLGLPTVNPADARVLMAADPGQAVKSIASWVPSLKGARVHLVLSPPAGNQPSFTLATDAWRRAFMADLLKQAGATIVSVIEDGTAESRAPGAPPAPVIPNLPNPTPQPLSAPRPGKPYQATLDSSAFFLPNSPKFLASTAQVLSQLQPIINGWRDGLYARVTVVGHCAQFGPRAGAVQLSRQRADKIAHLLRKHGVTAVKPTGVGYNQPLTPDPESVSNRVVIITAYPRR
jgi:outer membrane protein OmpA-like peptidoglycan-associated protein